MIHFPAWLFAAFFILGLWLIKMWCRHSELTKIQFGKLALISANSSFAQVEHSREYTFAVKKRFAVHASNISQVTLAEYSPRFWCERSFRALIPGVRCIRHVAERYFSPSGKTNNLPTKKMCDCNPACGLPQAACFIFWWFWMPLLIPSWLPSPAPLALFSRSYERLPSTFYLRYYVMSMLVPASQFVWIHNTARMGWS